MNLFTTITSERGKPVTKSGNEYIVLYLQDENRQNRIRMQVSMNKTGGGAYTGTMHVNLTDIQGDKILYAGYLGESKPKTAREDDLSPEWRAKKDEWAERFKK